MNDSTYMSLIRLLPRSAFSTLVGQLTRSSAPPWVHQLAIRAFVRQFSVDAAEAELELSQYHRFADFFVRRLKPGLRPVDSRSSSLVSPVDAHVSECGEIVGGRCVQAKGITYSVSELLADVETARDFAGGSFATLYLSPRDYHRIHSPLDGRITGYSYIPGEFWPVNQASVALTEALFCVNERLVTYLSTQAGTVALVAVGATGVARIRAAYDDVLTHRDQAAQVHRYQEPIPVRKGDEVAMFELGSTVVLLFQKGAVRLDGWVVPGAGVKVGVRLGECA